MVDITDRLRANNVVDAMLHYGEQREEAAREIERLRAALVQCKENATGAMLPSAVVHAIVDEAIR
ncbi:hypothetical protein [Leisingera daeponensis]|uniref:hypothetical protein n=1 Tax=Leisingera daeponensis TaxID=405746 RepID=UPI001C98555B|nr:hypothetical protein [Leisingera daeponensis]MBY6055358.1 hypothetical protein [Leisingera daeponensis]